MVWVKFHDKLCKGAKRGLPRAIRFVFMELCLEARPGRGVMSLPVGMSDLDGLHDVLGGNRKEIADALKALTAIPKPTADDPVPLPMVVLDGDEGARRLTIPSWDAWNSGQETPGASTARSRRHRRRPTEPAAADTQNSGNSTSDDDATPMQRSLRPLPTETQRSSNGDATPYRGEEIREEEITHTHRAGARSREDRTIGPSCSEADLADILSEIPILAELATDAEAVHDVYTGFVMTAGDTASPELARAALGALIARERLADLSPDGKRERVGTYLANARKYNRDVSRDDRPSDGARVSDEARIVLDVFADVWEKRQGKPFMKASGDDRKAAELVESARAAAERIGVRPREVVRYVAEGYLRDADPFLADKDYPFALFAARFGQYGLPKAPRKPATVPFTSPPPEEPYAPPPADLTARLAAVGGPGDRPAVPVRRPAA